MIKTRLNHKQLKCMVRFTDPFIHTPEKEESILQYYSMGKLRPPSLVRHDDRFLVFNGNHRVMVAIAHQLEIDCLVLENLEDALYAQQLEGDRYRDISAVEPLTFDNLVANLVESALENDYQDPEHFTFRDF